jgi:hypothetical protein
MTEPSSNELPAELMRLTRGERHYAVPFYQKFILKYDNDRPQMHEDNKRRVLNGAYFTAARFWMMPMTLFLLPGAIWLSFSTSVGPLILIAIACLFFCLVLWRSTQALKFFPHLGMVRMRITPRHPSKYD